MKKFTFLFAIIMANLNAFAQVTFEGSTEFGRIFDVTYHPTDPNDLYAVTLGNHIVSSKDNGLSWDVFYSHPTISHHIENLKFLDGNRLSFNLKFGLFDNHLNILDINTTQIVQTFVLPIPENAARTWITDYAIHHQNTSIAIVSQGYRIGSFSFYRVYYTTDSGITWSTIYSSIDNSNISVNSVAISHDNSQKVFIARGNGPDTTYGGLLISTNGGQSWTEKLVGIPLDPIAINPQNANDILIGTDATTDSENLYRSNDGGLTWQSIPLTWEDYVMDSIVHISFNPQNPQSIIVLEENQVIYTDDNFQTHTNLTFEEEPNDYFYGLNASFNPLNSNEIVVSGNYHPLRSTDNGTTFNKIENPFFVSNDVQLFKQNNIKKHLYYSVQFGYVHKDLDTNNSNNYNILPLNLVSNVQNQTFIDLNFNGRVYNLFSSFFGSSLYISEDHGTTNINIPIPNQYTFTVASEIATPNKVWVSLLDGDLQGNEGGAIYEIDFTDPNNILSSQIAIPAFKPVPSIYIYPNNYNTKMIALGSRIYKTTNNGQSWQISSNGLENALSLDNDIIFKIVANPLNQNQLSVATSQGIFTSYDNGDNWVQISTNLVEQIIHSPFNDGVIIAASLTRDYSVFNVFYTTNMGENWNSVSNDLLYNPFVSKVMFNFISNSFEIYAATSDIGIIKYNVILENLNSPDFETSPTIIVYPNPSKNNLFLESNESLIEIKIHDALGKKIKTVQPSVNEIDISELPSGLYILNVILENGKSESIRFIKE
ncbi:MAG TPA: T9SS type A sorting domain-containing protein [Flavobacterium sp.]|uniref:VPS10 domain-containing protein n=1 Tax=unclassified Flavobacterium TaxID=196869 RepID=UPI0025BDBFA0|nr:MULTISPECIES: T9SS type A sorting domain-containing protein [unclassified Flavobacterium]HRE76832.1 T9SS type A sorting domain-containing protein [Flavobacterium sp.]